MKNRHHAFLAGCWLLAGLLHLPRLAQAQGAAGWLDTNFIPQFTAQGPVYATAVTTNEGKILAGGWLSFSDPYGATGQALVQLDTNGAVDPGFAANPLVECATALIPVDAAGIVLAGWQLGSMSGTVKRLDLTGNLDSPFCQTNVIAGVASPWVYALARRSDGRVIVAGSLGSVNNQPRYQLFQLTPNGSLDTTFKTNLLISGEVFALALQPDGKLLAGGTFTTVGGIARRAIARLNADGALDTTFDPGAGAGSGGWIKSIALQPDGRILVGGHFTTFNATNRACLARLLSNGALDAEFNPGFGAESTVDDDPSVETLALQPNGLVLAGGSFDRFSGAARTGLARLNLDGSLDTSFDPGPGPNGPVLSLALQADGRILVAGDFTQYNGRPRPGLARLANSNALSPLAPFIPAACQPSATNIPAGATAVFGVTVYGTFPLACQWQKDGRTMPGQTASVLTLTNARVSDEGTYRIIVTNAGGAITSLLARLTITPLPVAPAITVPPASLSATLGASAAFSVTVAGTPPLAFQWRFNGVNMPGKTNSALVLPAVATNQAGAYSVVVTNRAGSVSSPAATLWVDVPPAITNAPHDLAIVPGDDATFSISATGTPPLSYQWLFRPTQTGAPILVAGATDPVLSLTNTAIDQAGWYAAVASNAGGSVTSLWRQLLVEPTSRRVKLDSALGFAGGLITVPVSIDALGGENALAFSIAFDPTVLTYQSFSNVSVAGTNLYLILNTSSLAQGRLGIMLGLMHGAPFTAGSNRLASLVFRAVSGLTAACSNTLAFTNSPIEREIVSTDAAPLPAHYLNAQITVQAGLEGDVLARPNGDGQIKLDDWILIGNLVAGLASVASPAEFVRADCAPRETLGDGALSLADWTQAGRYAAGIDAPAFAGGPLQGGQQAGATRSAKSGPACLVRLASASTRMGQGARLPVLLTANGNENALSFTLAFDPSAARYLSAEAGTALRAGSAMILNSNLVGQGRLGVLLALPPGQVFAAGTQEVLRVELRGLAASTGCTTVVAFAQSPVACDVVSAAIAPLPASFTAGSLRVESAPVPALSAPSPRPQGGVSLAWGLNPAGAFSLEASTNLVDWMLLTNLAPASVEGQFTDPDAPSLPRRFYRIR